MSLEIIRQHQTIKNDLTSDLNQKGTQISTSTAKMEDLARQWQRAKGENESLKIDYHNIRSVLELEEAHLLELQSLVEKARRDNQGK